MVMVLNNILDKEIGELKVVVPRLIVEDDPPVRAPQLSWCGGANMKGAQKDRPHWKEANGLHTPKHQSMFLPFSCST